jgi:hypothetical protein
VPDGFYRRLTMGAPSIAVPYEKQEDPQTHRGCGAACLSMVYKSFAKDVAQSEIWPLIAKSNRFGVVSSTTHLMALHAIREGLSAVIIQARHPLQVLRLCREGGIRAIINQRPQAGVVNGHYTVLLDVDDKSVIVHDPAAGPSRRMSHAELMDLWQPQSSVSEIAGNVLIGIAADPPSIPACEFCQTVIPPQVNCPKCKKAVALLPSALLGCIRDGCIARMWNHVACPSCGFLFNERNTYTADAPPEATPNQRPPALVVPDLEATFAQLDQFCNHLLSIPGAEGHPDLKAQIDFIHANKDKLRLAQAEEIGGINASIDRLAAAAEESKKREAENRKRTEAGNAPPPAADGKALGEALLKNLGFKK